jgi:hypothetical protein
MMRNSSFLLLVILSALHPVGASAADMRLVEVEYEDGYYTMVSEVWFDVAREPLFDVFLDWDLAVEFSSFIVESRNVGPDEDGGMGYSINNRGCVMFFCKTALRNGSVSSEAYEVIHAIADPAASDFEKSDETWTFFEEEDGTVVRYELEMKPDFWIPPVIGPYMIKKKLREDGGEAVNRIEEIAQEKAQERARQSNEESTASE